MQGLRVRALEEWRKFARGRVLGSCCGMPDRIVGSRWFLGSRPPTRSTAQGARDSASRTAARCTAGGISATTANLAGIGARGRASHWAHPSAEGRLQRATVSRRTADSRDGQVASAREVRRAECDLARHRSGGGHVFEVAPAEALRRQSRCARQLFRGRGRRYHHRVRSGPAFALCCGRVAAVARSRGRRQDPPRRPILRGRVAG